MRHALLAIAIFLIIVTAWRTRDFFMDDAWTGFRYVENLLACDGFVFQAGERVEGVTNAGWLLLLSIPSTVFETPMVAKVLGLLLCIAAVIICYALTRQFVGGPKAAVMAAPAMLLAATHFDFVYYALAGMETGLIAALLCAMALLADSDRRGWLLPLLGALAFLTRPEALLVYPLFLLIAAAARLDPPKRLLTGAGVFVALIAAITAARYAYYGALLPNTFGGKPTTVGDVLLSIYASLAGTNVNLSIGFGQILAPVVLAMGAVVAAKRGSSRRAGMAVAAVATGWLFATYAPADWTATGRYFGPYIPLASVLWWVGVLYVLSELLRMALDIPNARQYALLFAIPLLALSTLNLRGQTSPGWANSYPGYVVTSRNLIEPCRWMDEHLPEDATIATRRIGAVGYITDRYILDYCWGLVSPAVTRLVQARGLQFNDPNHPALREVWRRERPEFLLEDWAKVEPIIEATEGTAERFEIHGISYRVTRQFDIGQDARWTLCTRLDGPAP
jgi:hypothetical protein